MHHLFPAAVMPLALQGDEIYLVQHANDGFTIDTTCFYMDFFIMH